MSNAEVSFETKARCLVGFSCPECRCEYLFLDSSWSHARCHQCGKLGDIETFEEPEVRG